MPTPSLDVEQVDDNEMAQWNLLSEVRDNFYYEQIDSIELIPLETSKDILIGQISNIYEVDSQLVVIDGTKSQRIFVFDKSGHFLRTIGTKGKAKDEYQSKHDIRLNDEKVQFTDWLNGSLYSYNLNGEVDFIHHFEKGHPENAVFVNDSVILCSFAGYYDFHPFRLEWHNTGDSVLHSALPYETSRPTTAPELLITKSGKIMCYYNLSGIVYEVGADYIKASINTGLYQTDEVSEFMKQTDSETEREYMASMYSNDSEGITNYLHLTEMDSNWYVEFQKAGKAYISIVDKESNQAYTYVRSDIVDKKLYIPFIVTSSYGDYLLTYLDESNIEYLDDQTRQCLENVLSEKDQNVLKSYDFDSGNPLLCRIHIKGK